MQPASTSFDQKRYACAPSVAYTCHAIEECYNDAKPRGISIFHFLDPLLGNYKVLRLPVSPTLRFLVEKTIRSARRVLGTDRYERTTAVFCSYEGYTKTRNYSGRSVGMLRCEVVRALRKGDLEL